MTRSGWGWSGRARAVGAVVLALAVAACGSDAGTDDAGASDDVEAPAGEWVYVDGSGTETRLDEVPTRIVAHGSAAAALIPLGIRPVGIYADTAIEDDLALSQLDLDGIEIVGEEWGIINIEAVAALEPDLIVGEWWPIEKAYSGLEPGTAATSQQIKEIAPIVGVAQGPSIATMIEDYEELATSLGADLDDPEIAEAKERFETAKADFQAAVGAVDGLTALAVSPTEEGLYVAVPEYSAELSDFVSWGLDIVVPEKPDPGFEYWQTLSWENAGTYQADLVIIDERGYPDNLELAESQPTWTFLEAAEADAVAVWPAYWLRNHDDYADALDRLTEAVEAADPALV